MGLFNRNRQKEPVKVVLGEEDLDAWFPTARLTNVVVLDRDFLLTFQVDEGLVRHEGELMRVSTDSTVNVSVTYHEVPAAAVEQAVTLLDSWANNGDPVDVKFSASRNCWGFSTPTSPGFGLMGSGTGK